MIKIEAIVRRTKVDAIKAALVKANIRGLTISQVMGCGVQKGKKEYYKEDEDNSNLQPKIKIEIVADNLEEESIIKIITDSAYTGQVGDGKIFIYDVKDAIRIRTGERGTHAI